MQKKNQKITSQTNPKIKKIISLRKETRRKKEKMIIIEGKKELELAQESGIEIIEIFLSEKLKTISQKLDNAKQEIVSEEVFRKISIRENPDGYLALAKAETKQLEDINLSEDPLVVVLEAMEKPGNLGAILRTADAAQVDAVIVVEEKVNIYNPNVIRASLGTVFTNRIVNCSREKVFKWLQDNKIKSFAATPQAQINYWNFNYKEPSALWIGAEHEGLSREALGGIDEHIKIPMEGKIDSLNASVSTAVIVFEIKRQRAL